MKSQLLLCLLLVVSARAQVDPRMDFEKYDPPSSLVVPENPRTRAKFPFVDIHSHHWNMATQDLTELVREMDSLNMGVCVNLSGRGGAALKGIMDNIQKHGLEHRLVVFTNISFNGIEEPDWSANAVRQLEYDVAQGAKGLKIFKSLGLSIKDRAGQRIAIDDARLDPIWAKCGQLGIPVLIHAADPKQFWEPFDETNERWLELKTHPGRQRSDTNPVPFATLMGEQHRVFRKHPGTTFINAHFGWLANDLDSLSRFLDAYPHVNVEFGAVIAELGRQPRRAAVFFERHQDRILFGKDAYQIEEYYTYFRVLETADEYFPYYKRYHAFWRMYGLQLPDIVLEKIYFRNAARLLGLKYPFE